MLPGYTETAYFSPIFVYAVAPLKTGHNLLQLDFYNAMYATGVQGFSTSLLVFKRASTYLMGDLAESQQAERAVVISEINFAWLRFLDVMSRLAVLESEDVQAYLNRILFGT